MILWDHYGQRVLYRARKKLHINLREIRTQVFDFGLLATYSREWDIIERKRTLLTIVVSTTQQVLSTGLKPQTNLTRKFFESFAHLPNRVPVRSCTKAPNDTSNVGCANHAAFKSLQICTSVESDIFCFLNIPGTNILQTRPSGLVNTVKANEDAEQNSQLYLSKHTVEKGVQTFIPAKKNAKSHCVRSYLLPPCVPSQCGFANLVREFSSSVKVLFVCINHVCTFPSGWLAHFVQRPSRLPNDHLKLFCAEQMKSALGKTEQLVLHKTFHNKALLHRKVGKGNQVRTLRSFAHFIVVCCG